MSGLFKFVKIIIHIAILYGLFLIGNWIQHTFHLVIPGSVIGMILLFILLITNCMKLSWIEDGTKLFVNHLTLFFIPATVGIVNYLQLFSGKGLLLIIIVLISTGLVMGISGNISQWLVSKKELNHE